MGKGGGRLHAGRAMEGLGDCAWGLDLWDLGGKPGAGDFGLGGRGVVDLLLGLG